MSVNSLGSNPSALKTIADRVFEQADRDRDGRLSSAEFGAFLTTLLEGVSKTTSTETPASSYTPTKAISDDRPTKPEPFQPVASRHVFAGFSPENHLGETPTITAPKYAVYNELARLSNDPSFDPKAFAPTAAANLQKLFGNPMWDDGQPLFRAIDGETLAYGDEYVHYAPTGYALSRGEYNPEAPGEFFWGYRSVNG
jgi:EF hand domain-containing protein